MWSLAILRLSSGQGINCPDTSRAVRPRPLEQAPEAWWQTSYNRVRPHSSLGYRPPAPVTFPDVAYQLPMAATMQ